MEEIENHVEKVQEELAEHASRSRERWVGRAALTSAILAVCAAISSLLAGFYVNEAMIDQIKASDRWNYYQAKGIKASILQFRRESIALNDIAHLKTIDEKLEKYKTDQDEISKEAKEKEELSEHHLMKHEVIARAVTLFQVAIAIAAVSVLTMRRRFWFVSLGFGAVGLACALQGILI